MLGCMEEWTPYLVDILAPTAVVGWVAALLLFVVLIKELLMHERCSLFLSRIGNVGLVLMFLATLGAALGSLFFSEIALWSPCKLCWFQRVFLYPQVFILGLALWKNDRQASRYVLILSLVGAVIAVIHYMEQIQAMLDPIAFDPTIPCDLTGVSCRATEFLYYGFVSIPFMSLSVFLLNIALSFIVLRCEKLR